MIVLFLELQKKICTGKTNGRQKGSLNRGKTTILTYFIKKELLHCDNMQILSKMKL